MKPSSITARWRCRPGSAAVVSSTRARPGAGRDDARIADLPARFGIKGRAVEENLHLPRSCSSVEHGQHPGLTFERAVTDERRRPELLDQLPVAHRGWRAPAPDWPFAASRDCSRWRSMALAKPASSTLAPRPAAISRVSSIGKP